MAKINKNRKESNGVLSARQRLRRETTTQQKKWIGREKEEQIGNTNVDRVKRKKKERQLELRLGLSIGCRFPCLSL